MWKYLTPVVNFGEVRRAHLARATLLASSLMSLGLFRSFKVCSDAKERVGCGKQREAPHLFIPSKTATWVPEFAMEDVPVGRIAALVPEFAVKDLSLDRTLMMMMILIVVQLHFWSVSFFRRIMHTKSPVVNLAERHETLLAKKWLAMCKQSVVTYI